MQIYAAQSIADARSRWTGKHSHLRYYKSERIYEQQCETTLERWVGALFGVELLPMVYRIVAWRVKETSAVHK